MSGVLPVCRLKEKMAEYTGRNKKTEKEKTQTMGHRDKALALICSACVYICRFDPSIIRICGQVSQRCLPRGSEGNQLSPSSDARLPHWIFPHRLFRKKKKEEEAQTILLPLGSPARFHVRGLIRRLITLELDILFIITAPHPPPPLSPPPTHS